MTETEQRHERQRRHLGILIGALGMTREQAADALGISRQWLSTLAHLDDMDRRAQEAIERLEGMVMAKMGAGVALALRAQAEQVAGERGGT